MLKVGFKLELDPRYNNHTCGLCGDYNGNPSNNEFFLGDKMLSPIHFGNEQNVNDPNEVCKDTEETELINPANCSKYRPVCEELLGHSAFSDCMKFLNVDPYIKACMIDMCSCDEQSQDSFCSCSTISEYSRQCSHAGGRPGNWRRHNFCPKKCPANMIYQESASPCKNTCSHLEVHSLCEEHFIDGCFCPRGMVQDDYTDRGCVPVIKCHCKHQGKLYAPGESIQNDCDKCRCVAGRWNCTDLPCPKVCSIEGGAHFTTFDGRKYTIHGNCHYVLYKEGRRNVILGRLAPCGAPERETCLMSVTLAMNNWKTVVTFNADGTVLLNNLKVTLPHVTDNFTILKVSTHYATIQTSHGLHMQIQLKPKMQLYIRTEEVTTNQLKGLCGNFNYKEGDDFTTSGGLVEATASAFANTWKAEPTCHDIENWLDDPCSVSIENKQYADEWCSKLEDDHSPFAKCHSTIDPTEYVKRCHYDSCSCKDSALCMCAALSSYVRACAAKGIILWGWKKGICENDITSCPPSQMYLYNLTECQLTCQSLADGEKACAKVFTPVDGCGCPDGLYLNEKDQCVHMSKCSCYYHDTYLKPQEAININDKQCICQNGKLVCTDRANKTCPAGKVYFDCTKSQNLSGAHFRKSCKTLSVEYFQTECISGCVCPDGLLDDGIGHCVPEDRCPCVHNENIYSHGSQVKVDCNTCYCQRGRWTCTNTICHGTCTIYGSGHYISFDNKIYNFDGNCEFVAAQDYCETDSSGGSFSILTENIPCGTTGVTCSKSVTVFLGNTLLKLSEKHIVKTVTDEGNHVAYLTREVGIFLVIEASNGILLIWDKKNTIFIKVSPAYKGKLCGLCGNFDDNSQNDFTTRHMIQVTDVLEFGNSWKVDATCPDATDVVNPCSQIPHRHSWAQKQCGLIKSQVFKICHSKVDPKPFYEACVNDACSCDTGGDCECFCTAVAAYAQECTKAEACVYWRTPDICPIFCDYYNPKGECEWHYHPCGNHDVQTCHSINNVYTNVTITYLEGCYPTCPKDKPIFDEASKKCVTKKECGCYNNDVHYKSGEEVPHYIKCHKCTTSITTTITPSTIPSTASTEEWFSVNYPTLASGGEYETYENIRKAGRDICDSPLNISCRAKRWPKKKLNDLGQDVICDVSYGLTCDNAKQRYPPLCFDYEIQVYCCKVSDRCSSISPKTSGPNETTTPASITSTNYITAPTSQLPSTTNSTTKTMTSSTTTLHETTFNPTHSPSETSADTQRCTPICSWSDWISVNYPTIETVGDFETYQNIRNSGYDICDMPLNVSCRASHWPHKALHELQQKVTCDVSYGLICNNKEQLDPPLCFDYEISVYCCRVPDPCLHTSPQTSQQKSSTPAVTFSGSAGTKATTTWKTTETTTPVKEQFASTHVTPIPTTTIDMHFKNPSSTTLKLPQVNSTEIRTKTTTMTSPASTISAEPESTPDSTILPSPTTTSITISPTPPPASTSFIPSTSSTTTAPSSTSTVFHTAQQIITTRGILTSSTTTTPKTSELTSPTTSSTTIPITSVSRVEFTTDKVSLTSETNRVPDTTSTLTTNIELTSSASPTSSTTRKSTYPPTNPMPNTTESQTSTTSRYTTGQVTRTSDPSKVTTTRTTTSPFASSKSTSTSAPSELMQTSTAQVATATSNTYPSITTTSSRTTRIHTPESNTTTYSSTTVTLSESVPTSATVTSYSTTSLPITSKTTKVYTTSTFTEMSPNNTSTSTSKMTTKYISTAPSKPYMSTQPTATNITHKPMDTIPTSTSEPSRRPTEATSTESSQLTTSGSMSHVPSTIPGHLDSTITSSISSLTELDSRSTLIPSMTSASYTSPTISSTSSHATHMVSLTPEKRGCSFETFREPNETWMLKNCTRAKCLEDHTVEITELKCEPPPVITCANGYPPISVPDDDQCCWHWECACVCSGWGDPHYKTFDGTYYTFQGSCTYTLVEEIVKKNNLSIYIDNYDCGTQDLVSCPRNIAIVHNNQEIQLSVEGFKDPIIQVIVNGEIIGTPYKKYGTEIYTLGIYYVVEIPELGVNITYSGLTFYVKLPYALFGDNTQGQCDSITNGAFLYSIHEGHSRNATRLCHHMIIMRPVCMIAAMFPDPRLDVPACSIMLISVRIKEFVLTGEVKSRNVPCPAHRPRSIMPVVQLNQEHVKPRCVSPDNVPRKFGEKFQFGCQDCTCIEGGRGIICREHHCEKMTNVQCNLEGFYPEVQINPTDPCCNEIVCRCNRRRCVTKPPSCSLGYEAVSSLTEGHCCFQYQCGSRIQKAEAGGQQLAADSKLKLHGPGRQQEGNALGAVVYIDNCQSCVCAESANSTTEMKITCTDIVYDVHCPLGFAVKKSEENCCGQCEQTHCILNLNDSITPYHLMKIHCHEAKFRSTPVNVSFLA
ncbi:mucin-2-like [Leptodactylus fuscus]